jgi:hypothetical protein
VLRDCGAAAIKLSPDLASSYDDTSDATPQLAFFVEHSALPAMSGRLYRDASGDLCAVLKSFIEIDIET